MAGRFTTRPASLCSLPVLPLLPVNWQSCLPPLGRGHLETGRAGLKPDLGLQATGPAVYAAPNPGKWKAMLVTATGSLPTPFSKGRLRFSSLDVLCILCAFAQ